MWGRYLVHCCLDPHHIHVSLVWILLINTHDAGLASAHKNIIKYYEIGTDLILIRTSELSLIPHFEK